MDGETFVHSTNLKLMLLFSFKGGVVFSQTGLTLAILKKKEMDLEARKIVEETYLNRIGYNLCNLSFGH